jgi:hypothetical protein
VAKSLSRASEVLAGLKLGVWSEIATLLELAGKTCHLPAPETSSRQLIVFASSYTSSASST